MTTYRVTLTDGQSFVLFYDGAQPSAPIRADFFGEGEWYPTPYQTADVRDATHAAVLVAAFAKADADDCDTVATVEEVVT